MPLPGDITTIEVTGTCLDYAGNPLPGPVTFDPGTVLTDSTGLVILDGPVVVPLDSNGAFTAVLVCTDNADLRPAGWTYTISVGVAPPPPPWTPGTLVKDLPPPPAPPVSFPAALQHTLGAAVDLSALI